MTDETKNTEEIEAIAQSVPAPDEYPEGQAEELAKHVEESGDPNAFDDGVVAMVEATEDASKSAPAQAFDSVVTGIQRGIESVMDEPAETAHNDEHAHGDVTVFRGKTYDIPIYTSVFLALGFLTIIEVLIAEIISVDAITIPVLLGIAIAKAGLVVYFYMHLNTDSRVFALTLIVPIIIALLSAVFLFAIPTGY